MEQMVKDTNALSGFGRHLHIKERRAKTIVAALNSIKQEETDMKRKAWFVSLFLVVAMLATASSQTGTISHRITGVLEGTFTFVALPYTNNSEFATLGVVSGVVKDLGRSNMFTYHRHTTNGMEDGLVRIVAADGDIIRGQYTGDVVWGTPIVGTATVTITGGTGRFAKASGTLSLTAYVTMVNDFEWPVTWVLEGTIDY